MFDIGWSEILVIAIVAIVVVGPKDLPPMLRALGKWVRQMRKMAGDFQGQFNEALKEAELDGVRESLQELRSLNPMNDIKNSLNPLTAAIAKPASSPVPPPIDQPPQLMTDADVAPAPPPAAETVASPKPKRAAAPRKPKVAAEALTAEVAPAKAPAKPRASRAKVVAPVAEGDAPVAVKKPRQTKPKPPVEAASVVTPASAAPEEQDI
jgi:sec-independent protein translocase protein TatB